MDEPEDEEGSGGPEETEFGFVFGPGLLLLVLGCPKEGLEGIGLLISVTFSVECCGWFWGPW